MHKDRAVWLPALLLVVALPQVQAAEWSEWLVNGRYQHFYTENIGKTSFDEVVRSENIHELRFELGRVLQVTDSARLRILADLRHQSHRRFDQLDRTDPGLSLGLRNKSGLGPSAWWQELLLSYQEISPDDPLREGHQQSFGLAVGRRFSERFDGVLSWSRVSRDGGTGEPRAVDLTRPTDVFDQSADVLRLQWNTVLSENWLMAASLSRQHGDFDSQCPNSGVTQVVATVNPAALSLDVNVFGSCIYRTDGNIDVLDLEWVWNISHHISASLLLRHQDGGGPELGYHNKAAQLEVSYQF